MTTYDTPSDDKGVSPNNSKPEYSSTSSTDCTNNLKNSNVIPLELTAELEKEQMVTGFVFDKRIYSLRLSLNHKYSKKIVISPVEDNWPKTLDTLTKQLKLKHVKPHHIVQICDVVDNNADTILNLNDNDKYDDINKNPEAQNSRADDNLSEEASELLQSKISINDFIEYAFDTVRKTIKQENALVRQIAYTGLSAYTRDPLNLGIMAPTSEGKTYAVTEVMQLFPKSDVWNIGNMTPKVLIRLKGMIVNRNNEPIGADVKRLNKQIALLGNVKVDRIRKVELKEKLVDLLEGSKVLIDLNGNILLFLEPPDPELWKMIKPILSHDLKEIEYPYVDTTSGIQVKKIVVTGWPACIFCSAKDESKWPEWDQIRSRFQITSPNMIQKKYHESNLLIAQRKGLPTLLQQDLVVSDESLELAGQCIFHVKNQIQELSKRGNNPVWIPYGTILGERLPDQKGSDTRTTGRIFTFINIITMAKANLRCRLVFGPEIQIVAELQDLNEALHVTHNMSGLPTYKLKFYRKIFVPCLDSKTEPDKSKDKEEDVIAVTTRQLCEYHRKETGKSINTDNLRKTYLSELLDYGFIDEQDSVIHKQRKIYTATIRPPNQKELEEESLEWSSLPSNLGQLDENLHDIAISVHENCDNIPENWLDLAFSALGSRRIHSDQIGILSENGTKLSVNEFISHYQQNDKLIRYFSKPDFCNSNDKSRENANDSAIHDSKDAGSSSKRSKFDEKVEIFLERFKELESHSPAKIVNGEQIRDRLVSSGKFTTSDSVIFLIDMLRAERIVETPFPDTYRLVVAETDNK